MPWDSPTTRRAALAIVSGAVGSIGSLTATRGQGGGRTSAATDERCETTPTPTPPGDGGDDDRLTVDSFAFDREVDVVEDGGADPDGDADAVDAFESVLDPGTLVRVPEGTYRLDGTIRPSIGETGAGIVAEAGATLRLGDGFTGKFLQVADTDRFLLSGLDVEMPGERRGGLAVETRDAFLVEDVEYLGRGGLTGIAFRCASTTESGRGTLRNVVVTEGGYMDRYDDESGEAGNGRIGVWTGIDHVGTLRVEDCDFREFGNNGLYTSRCPGDVQVVDSYFENNNVASIRIGGAGSYVENCEVVVAHSRYEPALTSTESGFNTRGIVVEQGKGVSSDEFPAKPAGAEVRGSTVEVLDAVEGGRNVQAAVQLGGNGRSLTLRETSITVDVDGVPAIRRAPPGASPWRTDVRTPPAPHSVTVEDVEVSGDAAGGHAIVLWEAEGSTIRDTVVDATGFDRGGIEAWDCRGLVVDGGGVRASDFPVTVVERGAGAGDCRFEIREPPAFSPGNAASGAIVWVADLDADSCTTGSEASGAEVVRIAGITNGTVLGHLVADADDYEGASE
jgi:hypothetical protein